MNKKDLRKIIEKTGDNARWVREDKVPGTIKKGYKYVVVKNEKVTKEDGHMFLMVKDEGKK